MSACSRPKSWLVLRILFVHSCLVLGTGSVTFPPRTEDDLRLWVASDLEDLLFFANSDRISEWRDKSAYGNNFKQGLSGSVTVSSFASDVPPETGSAFTEATCVSFKSTFMEQRGFLGLNDNSDWTVFSVLQFEGDGLMAPFMSAGFTFDGRTGWALAKTSNQLGWLSFGKDGKFETVSGGVLQNNKPVVIEAQKQGDEVRIYLNEKNVVKTSKPDFETLYPDDVPLSVTIGLDAIHRMGSFSGCLGELLFFNTALDESASACLRWQLMKQYNLCEGSQCDAQIEILCASDLPESTTTFFSTPEPSTTETLHTSAENSPTSSTTATTPMTTPSNIEDDGETDLDEAKDQTNEVNGNNATTGTGQTGLEATGFQVVEVHWEWECLSAGCWIIDIEYYSVSSAINVLFLPRTDGDDQVGNGGGYAEEVRNSYGVSTFPCGTDTLNNSEQLDVRGTVCCLEEVVGRYRVVETFETWVGELGSSCRGSDDVSKQTVPLSTVLEGEADHVAGRLSGMPTSRVEDRGWVDPAKGLKSVRLTLDDEELRHSAGMTMGLPNVKQDIEMFVGMATLRPTGGKVMDSHTQQVSVRLERTNFFSMATHGNVDYSFLDHVSLRIHQIQDEAEPKAGPAQFLAVTFTIPERLSANPTTNIVPLGGVRVGRGSSFSSASWLQACASLDANASDAAPAVWEDDATREAFGERLAQTCAPAMAMCQSSARISDRFVAMNIPVGIVFFETGGSEKLFVELVVSVIEDTGKAVQTTLKGMVALAAGGVNTWCGGASADASLKTVADVDIIVGTAGKASELASLLTLENVASNSVGKQESAHIDASGIDGGLMTLVLKGNAEFFNLPGQLTTSLELEDVVTIHIMEGGTMMYDAVAGLIERGEGFELLVDAMDHRVSLTPHRELSRYCSFRATRPTFTDPFPTSCVVRRDVENRVPAVPYQLGGAPATAIELNAMGSTVAERATEAAFMQSLLGESDYAFQLGANFSSLIANKYQLNGQSRRAWWINTGYEWASDLTAGTPIFSLSPRVILAALIKLNSKDVASSRRLLLTKTLADPASGLDAKSMAQIDARFPVDATWLAAQVLGVPVHKVSTWKVSLLLTDQEVCMSSRDFRITVGNTIASHLDLTSSGVETVLVTSVLLDIGTVDCFGQRQTSERDDQVSWYSGASVSVEVAVVFTDETAIVNLKSFQAMPGVVEMEAVRSYHNVVIDNNWPSPQSKSTDFVSLGSGSNSWILATSVVGGGVGAFLGCAVGFIWYKAKKKRARLYGLSKPQRAMSARLSSTCGALETGNSTITAGVVFDTVRSRSEPNLKTLTSARMSADVVRSKWRQPDRKPRELFGRTASSGAGSKLKSFDLTADLNLEQSEPLTPASAQSESCPPSPTNSDKEYHQSRSSPQPSLPGLAVTLETEAYMAEMMQRRRERAGGFRPPPLRTWASQSLQVLRSHDSAGKPPRARCSPTASSLSASVSGSFLWIQHLFKPAGSSPRAAGGGAAEKALRDLSPSQLEAQPGSEPAPASILSLVQSDPASILDPNCPYPYRPPGASDRASSCDGDHGAQAAARIIETPWMAADNDPQFQDQSEAATGARRARRGGHRYSLPANTATVTVSASPPVTEMAKREFYPGRHGHWLRHGSDPGLASLYQPPCQPITFDVAADSADLERPLSLSTRPAPATTLSPRRSHWPPQSVPRTRVQSLALDTVAQGPILGLQLEGEVEPRASEASLRGDDSEPQMQGAGGVRVGAEFSAGSATTRARKSSYFLF